MQRVVSCHRERLEGSSVWTSKILYSKRHPQPLGTARGVDLHAEFFFEPRLRSNQFNRFGSIRLDILQ
jgi:hypothetical protein